VAEITAAYEEAHTFGTLSVAEAEELATYVASYSADRVVAEYWLPILEKVQAEMGAAT
jgi:hypothetical protein